MTATPYDPDVDPALQRRLDRVIAEINKLTDERDQLVIQAREDGASLREIAAHAGMTHTGVKKLLGRHLTPELQAQMDDELVRSIEAEGATDDFVAISLGVACTNLQSDTQMTTTLRSSIELAEALDAEGVCPGDPSKLTLVDG